MSLSTDLRSFPKLSHHAFQHPLDSQALAALEKMPLLPTLVKKFNALVGERFMHIEHVSNNLRVSAEQYPSLYRQYVRMAEVLVVAAGKPGLVPGEWVREGAVVVDIGINRREDGTLCGDVQFEEAAKRAAWITPVPGGVGPMTRAMLLVNTKHFTLYRTLALIRLMLPIRLFW